MTTIVTPHSVGTPQMEFSHNTSLDGLLQTGVPLLDIPAQLRHHGIAAFELCHFHLPTTDTVYLQALRDRLAAACVDLVSAGRAGAGMPRPHSPARCRP